jgi:hypothetical protein
MSEMAANRRKALQVAAETMGPWPTTSIGDDPEQHLANYRKTIGRQVLLLADDYAAWLNRGGEARPLATKGMKVVAR